MQKPINTACTVQMFKYKLIIHFVDARGNGSEFS